MSVATTRGITTAAIAALDDAGLLVGDGVQPNGSGWQAHPSTSDFRPYVTLHTVGGGRLDGNLGEPHDNAEVNVQPTCVGATRDQCELVADRARTALLAMTGTALDGDQVVMFVELEGLSGARRDTSVQPAVWITTDRLCIYATPSSGGS